MSRKLLIHLISFYQRFFSPFKPRVCRFVPSCSEYARQVIEEWGILRGLGLVAWRLLRCHPFHPGGIDPIPKAGEQDGRR